MDLSVMYEVVVLMKPKYNQFTCSCGKHYNIAVLDRIVVLDDDTMKKVVDALAAVLVPGDEKDL